MRLVKNIRRRLSSPSGETLVETLVSILVSSLALLMLAGAIGTAVNIVHSSREHMEDFYNGLGGMITGASTSSSGTVDLGVTIDKGENSTISVDVYESTDGSGVVLYKEAS